MYTGNFPHPPKRKKSAFAAFLLTGVFLLALLALLVAATAYYNEIYLVMYNDGVIMLGKPDALHELRLSGVPGKIVPDKTSTGDPAATPPLRLTDSPATVFDPMPADGRPLTVTEIDNKVGPSVTGILSESAYGHSSGSGIIMTEDGYIITNHHVVDGAQKVTVVLYDGTEYDASIVGSDRITDLAVLKIDGRGFAKAEFGNSDALVRGDSVVAIGNPLGMDLQNTVTNGIISGINRDITLQDVSGDISMNVLQTNCAVNPGNSGGPLINQYGQVIGIISSKIISDMGTTVEGLSFAIPINSAQPVLNQLSQLGYVTGRPALGVTVDTSRVIDEYTAQFYGLPMGVLVDTVNPKSDCHAKGIQSGDIITHVNGKEVSTLADVNAIKNDLAVGDTLKLSIYRQGSSFDVEVMLMEAGEMN